METTEGVELWKKKQIHSGMRVKTVAKEPRSNQLIRKATE